MMRKTRRKDAEIGKTQRKKHDANAQKSLKHAMQKLMRRVTQKSPKHDAKNATKRRRNRKNATQKHDANAQKSLKHAMQMRRIVT